MVKCTINGVEQEYKDGVTYEEIIAPYQEEYKGMIALVSANGKIRELFKKAAKECSIEFFTLNDVIGHSTYLRSASMLFLKAVFDIYGEDAANKTRIQFSLKNGLYVNPQGMFISDAGAAAKIKERMLELVDQKLPFLKRSLSMENANELFKKHNMKDKEELFRFRRSSSVNIYEIDGYFDYYYGFMLPNTGYVKWFDVISYRDGFLLLLPSKENPTVVDKFVDSPKLFDALNENEKWSMNMGIGTVGALNSAICNGNINDLVLVQEALQERKIADIAKEIVKRDNVKFVMIAGPSSSGKTSFSHRLSIQLRAMNKVPHPIALDDYYKNREDTPRDENGNYDFECLEAIDVKQFNDDMLKLLNGERVELPSFNFKTGKREYNGHFMQLGADDILVIEGIHGLNKKMSYELPEASKFKIYISALTNVNVDEHNRIPTTDGRLLRRMVRDARTRNTEAAGTLRMWASVRRGEEKYIFPFQEEADAMFNSATIYEIAALKQYAEPLLFKIDKSQPEYYEAARLLKFLDYFLSIPSDNLPINSICREFVGGSCFKV